MKRSRLLRKLDQEIAAAKTKVEADRLRGRQAVQFARLGQKDALTALLADLHRTYDKRPDATISIWLHLAEGLAIYFEEMGDAALGKVRRAHALSVAAGIEPLQALTAAWLAHLHFVRHELDQVATHLRRAFALAEEDDHATRARASLVADLALHEAGCPDLAAGWRRKARAHALAEGDDATIGALMHNVAWINMTNWRRASLVGATHAEGRHALVSTDSTGNFSALTGATSLMELQPLLRAQVLSLEGDVAGALALYEAHRATALPTGATRLQPNILADQAWCYAALDRIEEARAAAAIAEASFAEPTHVDDRAAAHSRLAQAYARLGDDDASRRHADLASAAWKATAEFHARIVALLGDLSDRRPAPAVTPPSAPAHPSHSAAPHPPATAP
jgi:hypothetical protein